MEHSEVKKVADLARLSLSDAELQTYGAQLTAILDYVRLLDEVDLDGVQPMPHAIDLQNVFRDDQRATSLDRAAALSNAPRTDGQFFLVPKILEEKGA
jgi:aspartyl-tRNA(Asn)/glutamyl-tRNA(Gln) amidotransferase subunit C